MKKYVVTLTDEERDELLAITSKGIHSSQKVVNALILLGCDVFAHSFLPRVYKEKLIRFCPLPTNILLMQPA